MAHRKGFAKKIDTVHWTLFAEATANMGAGSVAFNALAAQHLPETLLRIRGEWIANFSAAIAPGVGVAVFAGLILVPEGTSTTVLWSPITDGDAPWIWWDVLHLLYSESVTDVIASQTTLSGRRVMDSKAMRKVRNTELQLVVEQTTLTGFAATNIGFAASGRVLSGS